MKRIDELLKELTLEEKAALCSGVSSWETTPIQRLGIPAAVMSDGPHGLRKEVKNVGVGNLFLSSHPATCFPTAVTLSSTWDKKLMREIGEAIASECIDQGVDTVLGPGINIKRNPLCGRNFEYFSEDPYLAGELAASYVQGVQSKGIGVSLKHFATNNQETKRHIANSDIDERALREIYLAAFEKVVKKASPYTIMCSYNPLNGVQVSQNKRLLTDILRGEWDYKGVVISDWGAVLDRVESVKAGLNIEMPSSNGENDRMIIEAVKNGKLDEAVLDEVVRGVLEYVFKSAENREINAGAKADYEKNHGLARRAAAEGGVLLKNTDNILPVSADANFAVIGEMAKKMRYQGAGSSKIEPKNLVNFTEALDNDGIKYAYADGYSSETNKTSKKMIREACEAAKDKDYVLLFIGLTDVYESEGYDRVHIELPECQTELLNELYKYNKNIVAVLSGGSAVSMDWLQKTKAVLNLCLGGEACGEAAADVLFGKVSPCGKLSETYPIKIDDVLSTKYFAPETTNVEYRESIFVGYRYFDTANIPVLFPFGYGLSYGEFEYSDIKLSANSIDENEPLTVSFKVKNIGKRAASEIAQLYVKDTESTVFVPEKQLKGFEKIFLKPDAEKEIKLTLDRRAFAFYNVNTADWCVEAGEFEILVGASSKDIRLKEKVDVKAVAQDIPSYKAAVPVYYEIKSADGISEAQFETLLGRKVNKFTPPKKGQYGLNTIVEDLNGLFVAKGFKNIFVIGSSLVAPKGSSKQFRKMLRKGGLAMPVRHFYMMAAGITTYKFATHLVDAFNGKPFSLLKALNALRKKPRPKADIYPCGK